MPLEYITTRELENRSGEPAGKVRIMKRSEESQAQVELTCPECGATDKRKEDWGDPFTSGTGSKQVFNIVCKKCNFVAKLLKLKKEAARKK